MAASPIFALSRVILPLFAPQRTVNVPVWQICAIYGKVTSLTTSKTGVSNRELYRIIVLAWASRSCISHFLIRFVRFFLGDAAKGANIWVQTLIGLTVSRILTGSVLYCYLFGASVRIVSG